LRSCSTAQAALPALSGKVPRPRRGALAPRLLETAAMTRLASILLGTFLVAGAACGGGGGGGGDDDTPAADAPAVPDAALPTPDASTPPVLPAVQLCRVADSRALPAAFVEHPAGDAMTYTCTEPCPDVASCAVGLVDAQGPVLSARGGQMLVLAFVVDGMGGHLVYTPDGDNVLVTHGGVGGTGLLHEFDLAVQARSTIKTFSLGWERGVGLFGATGNGGSGWLTRKDAAGTTMRALAVRPAAAIAFVKHQFGQGKRLGTVGASFGTIATFGPHVWWGLDSILDYQLLIGGPPLWDVNVGCGRDHVAAGHCDVDVAACTGNPLSSYGNDDLLCGESLTNHCRVPTIMAQLPDGTSEFNNAINYVIAGTACAPAEARDPSLDDSSLATTVTSWSFQGLVDIVTQEGGPQPPQADQGMGEGHAMYVYEAIQSAKNWIDHDGHHHGDAWQKDPDLVVETAIMAIDHFED
jgi:hypothetical protein